MRITRWLPASCLLSLLLVAGPANAINVPGDFPTIQAAITGIALNPALNGSVIDVAPGQYFENLQIINTAASFTLRGAGPTQTAIRGGGSGFSGINFRNAVGAIRVENLAVLAVGSAFTATGGGFTVTASSPTFSNVHFLGNFSASDGGGGILTNTFAVFDNCLFDSNAANQFGGGVLVSGGSPTFLNTRIQNNVSGVTSPFGSGGGVHVNSGSPTFRNSIITGNQAKLGGGGIIALGPSGPITLTLEDSEVSGNTAIRAPGVAFTADGGGILIEFNVLARLSRTVVRNNVAQTGGGVAASFESRFEITGSLIEGNQASEPTGVGGLGGGVVLISTPTQPGAVTLTDSVVRNNAARTGGGVLVACQGAALCTTLTIAQSLIAGNSAHTLGGGVHAAGSVTTITNSQILQNSVNPPSGSAGQVGGGMVITGGTNAAITNTTIAANVAKVLGGGIYADQGAVVNINNATIHNNSTTDPNGGGGLFIAATGPPSGSVVNSRIADNSSFQIREEAGCAVAAPILSYLNNRITPRVGNNDFYQSTCPPGVLTSIGAFNALSASKTVGNVNSGPVFASFAATPDKTMPGLPSVLAWTVFRATSVNVNMGVGTIGGSTGTRDVSPACPTTYTLTAAPAGGPLAATSMGNSGLTQIGPGFLAYPAGFTGGVNVAFGTVPGIGPVIVTGAGPGGAPHVRVLRPDGTSVGDFLAYPAGFTGGVFVAFVPAGIIGAQPAIVTGAGPGGSPHVRLFRIDGTSITPGILAYNPLFPGGVSVGFAPNLAGAPAILTAPGPGGGPHVRAFNVSPSGNITERGGGIFAYNPLFTGGVTFAVGDVNGDGTPEVITAAGPSGGPHVRFFNVDGAGNFTEPIGGGFFAFEPTFTGGVSIAVGNVDNSGRNELATAHLAGSPLVRLYSVSPGGAVTAVAESSVYDPGFNVGVRLAAGDLNGNGRADIITAPGTGGGPHIKMFEFPCQVP